MACRPVNVTVDKGAGEASLQVRRSEVMLNSFSIVHAASRRSGVRRLITPSVKWRAPTGRMALGGSSVSLASLGEVTSEVKRWRAAWNCGLDVAVIKGRQRKWVNWGFGGMAMFFGNHRV